MPLMCCDACSELDYKPFGLGAVHVCVCAFCKKLSTHSAIVQRGNFNPKQTKSEEILVNDPYTWIHASGAIEKANSGLSFYATSFLTTFRYRVRYSERLEPEIRTSIAKATKHESKRVMTC